MHPYKVQDVPIPGVRPVLDRWGDDGLVLHDDLTATEKKIPLNLLKTPRPLNAWILYRGEFIRSNITNLPTRQRDLSKVAAASWRALSDEEKQPYFALAKLHKEEHERQYPNYKYQPVRRGPSSKARTRAVGKQLSRSIQEFKIVPGKAPAPAFLPTPATLFPPPVIFTSSRDSPQLSTPPSHRLAHSPATQVLARGQPAVKLETYEDELVGLFEKKASLVDEGVAQQDFTDNSIARTSETQNLPLLDYIRAGFSGYSLTVGPAPPTDIHVAPHHKESFPFQPIRAAYRTLKRGLTLDRGPEYFPTYGGESEVSGLWYHEGVGAAQSSALQTRAGGVGKQWRLDPTSELASPVTQSLENKYYLQ